MKSRIQISAAHSRRQFLLIGAAAVVGTTVGTTVGATVSMRPTALLAQDRSLAALVGAYAGAATPREGRVTLEIAKLVDNGNSVPIVVFVDSPMTATDRVVGIAIFNEKNPQHEVAEFVLGTGAGKATVATRIRLATTQKLVAVAKMNDGRCWMQAVEVIVTLAACLEE